METYLRLMFLKHRYQLGHEPLCAEVSDSISWRRFCRIDIDGRVPHPTTLMKITARCGDATVAELNEQLLATAVEARVADIAYKRRRLIKACGRLPANTTLTAVNLETDDLTAALTGAGFDWHEPALFIGEAVTQYLTENAVRETLARLGRSAAGSRLIFTYLRLDFLDDAQDYGAAPARQEFVTKRRIWRFGLQPDQGAGFLREYGWTEREQVGPAEYTPHYLEPAGRDLPVSPIERLVAADR